MGPARSPPRRLRAPRPVRPAPPASRSPLPAAERRHGGYRGVAVRARRRSQRQRLQGEPRDGERAPQPAHPLSTRPGPRTGSPGPRPEPTPLGLCLAPGKETQGGPGGRTRGLGAASGCVGNPHRAPAWRLAPPGQLVAWVGALAPASPVLPPLPCDVTRPSRALTHGRAAGSALPPPATPILCGLGQVTSPPRASLSRPVKGLKTSPLEAGVSCCGEVGVEQLGEGLGSSCLSSCWTD